MNSFFARLLFAPTVTLALLMFGGTARAEMKVAVVDVQRAVMQTEDGLRAQATLPSHRMRRPRKAGIR